MSTQSVDLEAVEKLLAAGERAEIFVPALVAEVREARSRLAMHRRDERVRQVIAGLRIALDARFADNSSVLEYVLATNPHLKQRLCTVLIGDAS